MKKVILFSLFIVLFFSGCAGVKSNDPDKLNDALVLFTTSIQGDRWEEALSYISKDEVYSVSDGKEFKPEYQLAARRLNLSTLKQMDIYVDGTGRLVGIKKALDDTNERYKVSEEQAKVGSDLEQKEQARIQQSLEKGRRILESIEEEPAEPEVEVYTNKLTEEEKRKYGSTGELLAPEEYADENTEEAEDELYGGTDSDF